MQLSRLKNILSTVPEARPTPAGPARGVGRDPTLSRYISAAVVPSVQVRALEGSWLILF